MTLVLNTHPTTYRRDTAKMNLSFFEQRIYQSLKRKGLAPQFERAGIYAILLDGKTVYIGKSVNMLARMAQQCGLTAAGGAAQHHILAFLYLQCHFI